MGYGLDISSSLSMLAGLSRKGGNWRLTHASLLTGFQIDPGEDSRVHAASPLGSSLRALRNQGVKAAAPVVLIPSRDLVYRVLEVSNTEPENVMPLVRLEAEEVGGESGSVLADYMIGSTPDYSPVAHIGLARESTVDHYAAALHAASIRPALMVPGCAALFNAWLLSGDVMSEGVVLLANIGEDATDVVLVQEGQLLFARSFAVGVGDFIDRLAPEYNKGRDELRRILFREVDLRPSIADENLSQDRGVEAAQEVASRLFQQVGSAVMLAKGALGAPRLDARRFLICGPGAAIPGMRELMMHRTRKPVEVFDPLEGVDVDGLDEASQAIVKSYRPAMALAVGLARIATEEKPAEMHFTPASVRRRREFLHKSIFLYLAAALVILVLLPVYVLSGNAAGAAAEHVREIRNSRLGSYSNASAQLKGKQAALDEARRRAEASAQAIAPGKRGLDVLLEAIENRPAGALLRSAKLGWSTPKDPKNKDETPEPELTLEFFFERKAGSDPAVQQKELREFLKKLPQAASVIPREPSENPEVPGIDVVYVVRLKTQEELK